MNKSKGFTLVELLVVIAIIAILATISIGGLLEYMKESAKGAAIANARNCISQLASAQVSSALNNNATFNCETHCQSSYTSTIMAICTVSKGFAINTGICIKYPDHIDCY